MVSCLLDNMFGHVMTLGNSGGEVQGKVNGPWVYKPTFKFIPQNIKKQGKSEGFDSCDQPSNLTQIGFKSSIFSAHVTLKFDGWPQKTIGHLVYAILSFLHHLVPIGEFKLELQCGNA